MAADREVTYIGSLAASCALLVFLLCPARGWTRLERYVELVCPAYLPETGKLVEALPLLADQGVTAIELGLGYTDYFDHRDAVEMTALLSVLASCGLRVHSVHSPCGQYCDLSSLDDSIHERGVDALIE